MVLNVILLVLSIIIDGLICYIVKLDLFIGILFFIVLIPFIFILLFGIEIILLFIWSLFIDKKKEVDKPNNFYLWFVYQVNYQVCFLSNTKIVVTGKDLIPQDRRYIIIYNHLSNFDPMVLMKELINDRIVCMTKIGNENIPIAGSFIHKAGFISIDRDSPISCAHSVIKAVRYLNENYCSIAIAPEGTRNKEKKNTLLPFHNGFFKVAKKTNLPLVISIVENTDLIHKNFPFKRTVVHFRIIKVMNYLEYKDMTCEEIKDYVFNIMKESLEVK